MVKKSSLFKKERNESLVQKKVRINKIQEIIESLILAQDERWRYALHMQVERKFLT